MYKKMYIQKKWMYKKINVQKKCERMIKKSCGKSKLSNRS